MRKKKPETYSSHEQLATMASATHPPRAREGEPLLLLGWRWIVDAHRGDGRRYIVQSDELLLSAFLELERVTIGQ